VTGKDARLAPRKGYGLAAAGVTKGSVQTLALEFHPYFGQGGYFSLPQNWEEQVKTLLKGAQK